MDGNGSYETLIGTALTDASAELLLSAGPQLSNLLPGRSLTPGLPLELRVSLTDPGLPAGLEPTVKDAARPQATASTIFGIRTRTRACCAQASPASD